MKERFSGLAGRLEKDLKAGETLLCLLSGERSDFVRFNRALVRQAGTVEQCHLTLRLVRSRRHAYATMVLAGNDGDEASARSAIARLRESLDALPEDPWLLINEQPQSTDTARRGRLADPQHVVHETVARAGGRDMVGFYAGGTMYRGFANSLGQRNWHECDAFDFDWSLYRQGDQAVKTRYAGSEWQPQAFAARMEDAARQLELLATPRRAIDPGEYRAYLAPAALHEVTSLLSWGGFSARARQTKQSPFLLMQEGAESLSPKVTLIENTAQGTARPFQGDGFVKPPRVTLVDAGRLGEALTSPRTAKEYGLRTNAAGGDETPDSLDMAPGSLAEDDVLRALDRGLYISNLWYLNFSDRAAGRITGMTRFATFWVEGGRIVAPVGPMRFDDSVYRMLGTELLDLTREARLLPESSTYGERSTGSTRLPGALLGALRFTL